MKKPKKICLINVSGIGDVISSLVVAQALPRKNHRIFYVIRPSFIGLLKGSGYVETSPEKITLKAPEFDVIIDLTSNKESRKICGKLSAPVKIGRFKNRVQKIRYHFLYSRMVEKSRHDQIVRDYYPIIEALGYDVSPIPQLPTKTLPNDRPSPSICIHIGADNEKRRIPLELILKIIAYARSSGIRVRLIGTETDLAGQILEQTGNYPVYEMAALDTVMKWLVRSDLVIAPDSGILHLAAALDKKGIGIYGPNTFARSGPLSDKISVIELDYDCRPCVQKNPCPHQMRCMNCIKFEMVRKKMELFFKRSDQP
jgi:ADP-heptose:LPS heptosyltransferase